MSTQTDGASATLTARAVQQALDRLRMLGLVDGDMAGAGTVLERLIGTAIERGERNQENLILFAMGRFQAGSPADGR
jgi:hypothetical protein